MGYNTFAQVVVVNNFSGPADITLSHTYSDDDPTSTTWSEVGNGLPSSPSWQVGYNTGFVYYGNDYWHVSVHVLSGAEQGTWASDMVECTMHSGDSTGVLYFSVSSAGGFNVHLNSGSCNFGLHKTS